MQKQEDVLAAAANVSDFFYGYEDGGACIGGQGQGGIPGGGPPGRGPARALPRRLVATVHLKQPYERAGDESRQSIAPTQSITLPSNELIPGEHEEGA